MNSNNNINSYNKIIINAYGCENLEFITNKLLKKLVNVPGKAIPELVKIIHFNKKYPENRNLNISNIHDQYINVHDGDKWNIKKKSDIIENIIYTKRDLLNGVLEEESDDKYIKKLNNIDKAIEDDKNTIIEDKVKEVLINESK